MAPHLESPSDYTTTTTTTTPPSPSQPQPPTPPDPQSKTQPLLLLLSSYALLTSTLFYRTSRSSLSPALKQQRYRTILGSSTIGAAFVGGVVTVNGRKLSSEKEVRAGGYAVEGQPDLREAIVAAESESESTSQSQNETEKDREEARTIIREGGVQRD